jgi:UDP-galactopyranose mutase
VAGKTGVLVVGAGFAGAVHARELAEHGYTVHVVDRRHHVAGNAYDEVTPDGTRVHRYGPHLFHTSNPTVVQWLQRFGAFEPYTHRVVAEIDGPRHVPLPVNRTTINAVFSLRLTTDTEVADFLRSQAVPCEAPRNAAEYLYSRIGRTLAELFFRPYTRKMWALDLEDMHESVVRRVPQRLDEDSRYFPADAYQVLPKHGYASVVAGILDHSRISVSLRQHYARGMERGYSACFNSMPIDEYFDFAYGPLPYRSLRFHHRRESIGYARGPAPVVNFTDSGNYTRETDWSMLPLHQNAASASKTITTEEPCDYQDNAMERYYPVRTNDDRYRKQYDRYLALALAGPAMRFIGRCGTYQYLDMDQVINQSLQQVTRWLGQQ